MKCSRAPVPSLVSPVGPDLLCEGLENIKTKYPANLEWFVNVSSLELGKETDCTVLTGVRGSRGL